MPVYPPVYVAPEPTGHYPHFEKHDAVIWERFLDVYGAQFEQVAYNVALGGVRLEQEDIDPAARAGWQYTTALRPDVIALRGQDVWLIEVKPSARASALGQALCYAVMAERDGAWSLPLVACVVTDQTTPDIRYCAAQLGVRLVEVPAA